MMMLMVCEKAIWCLMFMELENVILMILNEILSETRSATLSSQ